MCICWCAVDQAGSLMNTGFSHGFNKVKCSLTKTSEYTQYYYMHKGIALHYGPC